MTTREEVTNHYNDINGRYDNVPILSDARSHNHRLDKTVEFLRIDPLKDTVVDMGAGTAAMGKLWAERYPGARPMICVDPSPMLPQNDKSIDAFHMDAIEFAERKDIKYDAMMFIQSFHNVVADRNPVDLLESILDQLNDGGRVCVATRPRDCTHFPWFKKSHETVNVQDSETIVTCLKEAGFSKVKIHKACLDHKLTKETWYRLLTTRFFSHLSLLTDEEIEDGLEELDQGLLKGKEVIEIPDKFNFICAWK